MLFKKIPQVKIIGDVEELPEHYISAVMFTVQNGLNKLRRVSGEYEGGDPWYRTVQLLLNDKPIIQGRFPDCPTCAGLLAAGFGIENIDSPELKAVSQSLNSDFIDISTSANALKPLLELLPDGLYILADIPHSPTDGEGGFFYEGTNDFAPFAASADMIWSNGILNGYPKYLYPTQSAGCIDEARVNYYKESFSKSAARPRALAYYEKGFISTLLDGHHKACAAALSEQELECLTIINADGIYFKEGTSLNENGYDSIDRICFGDIPVKKELIEKNAAAAALFKKYHHKSIIRRSYYSSEKEHITEFEAAAVRGSFNSKYSRKAAVYDTVTELADVFEVIPVTDKKLEEWFTRPDYENSRKLCGALQYMKKHGDTRFYETAVRAIKELDNSNEAVGRAYSLLLTERDQHTEQLFIDYLINNTDIHSCHRDIVLSYWEDEKEESR